MKNYTYLCNMNITIAYFITFVMVFTYGVKFGIYLGKNKSDSETIKKND